MPVLDKYRPVDPTPTTLTPVLPTLAGLGFTTLVLSMYQAVPLQTWVAYEHEPNPAVVGTIDALTGAGEATGLVALHHLLESVTAPLDRSAQLFRRRPSDLPGVVPITDEVEATPPEPTLPPGERWSAIAQRGVKRRVLIVGASSIQYAIGTELERELAAFDLEVYRKGKVSTGLTRDDVFDWPAEVERLIADFQPDVVIGQFGGNDAQPIISPTEGRQSLFSEGWVREYTRRLDRVAQAAKDAGALPIFLGMPVMRSSSFSGRMARLNDITQQAIEAQGGRFLATADLSSDDQGAYQASVRFEGRSGRMRMDDGIHFTRLGGQFIADGLIHRLQREVVLVPKPPEDTPDATPPATAHPFTVPAGPHRGDSPLLAFVPQDVPLDGLPVWTVLHGAWGSYADWSEHAHDDLAQLAAEHRMIIVLPDGEPHGWYLDSTEHPDHQLATWLSADLLPWVDATLPSNGTRALSGNSMGGHGALNAVLDHPKLFQAVTSWSGAVDLPHAESRDALKDLLAPYAANPTAWEARSVLHRLRDAGATLDGTPTLLSCGDKDTWYPANLALHDLLTTQGVEHTWLPQKGGHTWALWTGSLPEHAAFVAQVIAPPPPAPAPEAPPAADDALPDLDPSTEPDLP